MKTVKVFISGTQDDMQPERDAVSRAVDSVVIATGIHAGFAPKIPFDNKVTPPDHKVFELTTKWRYKRR
jgi:hypothetical protein